jgi:hypothetical protein
LLLQQLLLQQLLLQQLLLQQLLLQRDSNRATSLASMVTPQEDSGHNRRAG